MIERMIPEDYAGEILKNFSEADKQRVSEMIRNSLGFKTEAELNNLKKTIEKNSSQITVMVHPKFLEKDLPKNTTNLNMLVSQHNIAQWVAQRSETKPGIPLFIYEGDRGLMQDYQNSIVFPTAEEEGVLRIDFLFDLFKDFDFMGEVVKKYEARLKSYSVYAQKNIPDIKNDYFINIRNVLVKIFYSLLIAELGIKKVVLGGIYYGESNGAFLGCVGNVKKSFEAVGVKIEIDPHHMDFTGFDRDGKIVEE